MNDWTKNRDLRPQAEEAGPVRLRLLGAFWLADPDGHEIAITSKKNRALLAVLALSPGGQATRDRLCGLLWGDRDQERARNSLRQSLAVLRKELGGVAPLVLQTRDDVVGVRQGAVQVDAVDILDLADTNDLASLRQAAGLYRGELLADTSVRDPGFDEWLSVERRRMVEKAIGILEKLSAVETGPAQVEAARHLVSLDPLREASHRALMHALAEAGETALALQQFEVCRAILKAEFGVDPAAETTAMRTAIVKANVNLLQPAVAASSVETIHPLVTPDGKPSIAVLPFINLNDDPERQYFADGITQDIITELSRFKNFNVISRNAKFRTKDSSEGLVLPDQSIGTQFILKGTVRRASNRIRIAVQLVDSDSGAHIWTDRYDRDLEDVLTLQDEIVRTVASTVSGRVEATHKTRARRLSGQGVRAYDMVLRAAMAEAKYTRDSYRSARQYVEQAIELDPEFAPAYLHLSLVNYIEWTAYWVDDRDAAFSNAMSAVLQAITLEDENSNLHAHYGMLLMHSGDYENAEHQFNRAMDLNANDSKARSLYGFFLTAAGRSNEAVDSFGEAARLNPFQPDWANWLKGIAYFTARRYEDAILIFKAISNPMNDVHGWLAMSYAHMGDTKMAQSSLDVFLRIAAAEMNNPPEASITAWKPYWHAAMPYRNQADAESLYEGLRKAGMKE